MDKEQTRAAKARFVAQMQAGQPWHVAAAMAGLPMSQSTAYRLCQAVRERGEVALQDGRQGHPVKLRGEVRTFLEASCRKAPHTPSSTVQAALRERFGLNVSISQGSGSLEQDGSFFIVAMEKEEQTRLVHPPRL